MSSTLFCLEKSKFLKKKERNYAFIDSQNLNLGIRSLGRKLDYRKFRLYLREKYDIRVAYCFIGFMPSNQPLYSSLQEAGYILVLKPTVLDREGKVKGNVDADLILQVMLDYDRYDKALIITSDGDFYSLVKYLYGQNKLKFVMSPYVETCSVLLRKTAREKIVFMSNLRQKLEYKKHR